MRWRDVRSPWDQTRGRLRARAVPGISPDFQRKQVGHAELGQPERTAVNWGNRPSPVRARLHYMDEQQVQSGNSHAMQRPIETKGFQAASVPVTLELLIARLDQARYLLKTSTTSDPLSSVSRQYQNTISVRERRALDTVIDAFWSDLIDRGKRELEKFGMVRDLSEADDPIYPLSAETASTFVEVVLRNVKEETFREKFSAYANDPPKTQYIMANVRLGTKVERESTLGAALLPFIVSKMEEFLGSLVRTMLVLYPETLGELKPVPTEIIRRYSANISSSDLLRWQIDQKVASFLQGSPEEWRDTLNKKTKIDIASAGADWDAIMEVIQRRHAVVHNNGRVDNEYLSKVPERLRSGLEEGSTLVCSTRYMTSALVEIETWAICLSLFWAKHFFKDNANYHPSIISRVVDLESLGRWTQALAVLDALLKEPLPPDAGDVSLARINRWFCLQEIGRDSEALEREINAFYSQELDSESAFRFEVGRAALLRNYSELLGLFRAGMGSETLGFQKKHYREMPLIRRAMKESPPVERILQGAEASAFRATSRLQNRGRRGKPRRLALSTR